MAVKKGNIPWNKGLKTGLIPKTAFKKGNSGYWLGKKRSKEVVEKLRIGFLGHKHTNEARRKISEGHKGDKARSWKGGITPINNQIRHCFKMRQWRSDVFTRDDFTCQECGERGGELQAHHIKSFSQIIEENNIKTLEDAEKCEELWNINNGVALCKDCHSLTDSYGNDRRGENGQFIKKYENI